MAKNKLDGVVEAVHYGPDGQIAWVRAYERRGPTFSDRVLIDRPELVKRLKARQNLVIGSRKPQLASTFETGAPLMLFRKAGREIVLAGVAAADRDTLHGAPQL